MDLHHAIVIKLEPIPIFLWPNEGTVVPAVQVAAVN